MVRMTKKLGPFRLTVSKTGVGYSAGGGPFRLTKRADGRVQRTLRIPRTGISDTRVVSRARTQQPARAWQVPPPMPYQQSPQANPGLHGPRPDDGAPGGEVLLVILGVLGIVTAGILLTEGAFALALLLAAIGAVPLYFAKVIRAQRRSANAAHPRPPLGW